MTLLLPRPAGSSPGGLQEGQCQRHQGCLCCSDTEPLWTPPGLSFTGVSRCPQQPWEGLGLRDLRSVGRLLPCADVSLRGLVTTPERCSWDRCIPCPRARRSPGAQSCLPACLWSLAPLCILSHLVLNPCFPGFFPIPSSQLTSRPGLRAPPLPKRPLEPHCRPRG